MQLGARWAAGTPPHRGVPPELHPAIAAQEAAHPEADSWTLTWLEGRPRCLLGGAGLEPVALVTADGTGSVVVEAIPADGDPGTGDPATDEDDTDEDDWLS
ncbi:Fe-S oxidoreductase [Leucobacter sp.]